MEFVLASQSPRRKDILAKAGYSFEIVPCDKEEIIDLSLTPTEIVKGLALQKAQCVFEKVQKPTLGADTVVVLDGRILGKPKDKRQSIEMLKMLSGRTHEVITGVAFVQSGQVRVFADTTVVEFNDLSDEVIRQYTDLGLGMDKAGGYGAQDGFGLVKRVIGSYYNVVGLPLELLEKEIFNEK